MEKIQSYSILKELFESVFSERSDVLSTDLLYKIFRASSEKLGDISEEFMLKADKLAAFRSEAIEVLAEMHYRNNLNDNFTALLVNHSVREFTEHLTFLREMEAGIHYLEKAELLSKFREKEASLEGREIEAAITLNEREKLLNQFKLKEAQIKATAIKASDRRRPNAGYRSAAAREFGSNRISFLRIAAILILVLIPTSIIIYFNNSNPVISPQKTQTAEGDKKKDLTADPSSDGDMMMGSSPDLMSSIKANIPELRIESIILPVIDEDSFGFAGKNDSIAIEFQFLSVQEDYYLNQRQIIDAEIIRLDSVLIDEISVVEFGVNFMDIKDKIESLKNEVAILDSLNFQNLVKLDSYEFKNKKIMIYLHCKACSQFNFEDDEIEIIKESNNLFLMFNGRSKILIEEGIHDFKFE